jgi:hypothetical protein
MGIDVQERKHTGKGESSGHLKMSADDAKQSATSGEAARQAVHLEQPERKFGRVAWWAFVADTLFRDVRYGLRRFRKQPAFTGLAVTTLALGVGATTTIFSVIYSVLLNPFPLC